jgi:phosphotransacetylase
MAHEYAGPFDPWWAAGATTEYLFDALLAHADCAGIVLGAKVPIILTSRTDTVIARLASCAVAVLVAQARRESAAKAIA